MLRGFYTAASGILSQQRTLDVLTNNIANVRTPGFRASRVVTSSFEQELLTRMEGNNSAVIGLQCAHAGGIRSSGEVRYQFAAGNR